VSNLWQVVTRGLPQGCPAGVVSQDRGNGVRQVGAASTVEQPAVDQQTGQVHQAHLACVLGPPAITGGRVLAPVDQALVAAAGRGPGDHRISDLFGRPTLPGRQGGGSLASRSAICTGTL
jgi:hypothetical protein